MDSTTWRLIKSDQLNYEFSGFDQDMIFELSDGTIYVQSDPTYYYTYLYRPSLNIYQVGNSKILVVDGIVEKVEIEEVFPIKSTIISAFSGWTGNSVFELQNGQIWKQDQYAYQYFYKYRPNVMIVNIRNYYLMIVDGKRIRVTKIR